VSHAPFFGAMTPGVVMDQLCQWDLCEWPQAGAYGNR
jgi:hypothetical protein